jgi:peptidoglycan-associated lipoprotein
MKNDERSVTSDAWTGTDRGGNDQIMMRQKLTSIELRWIPIFLAALLVFAVGCSSTPDPVEDADSQVDSEFSDGDTSPMQEEVVDVVVADTNFTIAPVYFDLDQVEIRDEFGSILRSGAGALKDSNATVVIEGHCDERGSADYNLALGERRAGSVRKYLYNLGVPMGQMSIVSYGEAQPAVSGTGETAWQLNRRAQFQVR